MVAECDFKPDEFWELSLYEWSLYLYRYKVQAAKRLRSEKTFWQGISVIWSVLMNGLFSGKKGEPRKIYAPEDLVRFDDEKKEDKKEPEEDLVTRVKRKHGATV